MAFFTDFSSGLRSCHTLADLRSLAQRRIPKVMFDYIDGGAEDEVTLQRNCGNFAHYELLPHTLVDVSQIDLSTRIQGLDITLPLIFAPTGASRLFHHDGELAVSTVVAAEHIVLLYPLWLGSMPALLKGFLEQVLRPGFAFGTVSSENKWQKKLKGKSARIVITMGMPALAYRWFYRAHGLKSLQRNILAFCGIGPISSTLIGMVESHEPKHQEKALRKMEKLGRAGK